MKKLLMTLSKPNPCIHTDNRRCAENRVSREGHLRAEDVDEVFWCHDGDLQLSIQLFRIESISMLG